MANAKKTSAKSTNRKPRTERKFPALIFEEALEIAEGIQKYAAGQRVRRVTLFEKLNKEPDSLPARRLVTASGQIWPHERRVSSRLPRIDTRG
jgi:5-formyltetrahydrofolate cyclo-ligase